MVAQIDYKIFRIMPVCAAEADITVVTIEVDSVEEEDSRERQMDGKVKLDTVTQEVRCHLFLVKLIKLR